MSIIYGVDTSKPVTPLMVRDALSECFYEAHCRYIDLKTVGESTNKEYCRNLVKKAFADSGGDFENPTKESIERAVAQLVEFSKNFRDPSLVAKHAAELSELIKCIK